jgi:hypothetical protein
MTTNKNIDSRMDAALKEDAARLTPPSSEVPASLRSLISSTQAATTTPMITAATTAKFAVSKIALWSIGGLIVAAAGDFALAPADKTPLQPQSQPALAPMIVEVDSPKTTMDTSVTSQQQAATLKKAPGTNHKAFTQAQIDSMMRAMPEPENTIKDSGSIKGELKKRK